jgi:RHS repeat-associated protein
VRSYSYDHANRLTQVTEGSVTTQFAYNGDGVRTSKTVAGDTTEYALDLVATLPVVISDTEAVYLYGLDIIAQQQAERLYYVHDGLGSVRQLLDTTGQIETNYAYDPFGVPVVGGEVYNPYQYTGEAWDAEVELLYLRARYYQPEVGRFVAKDPWEGDARRPGTLNGYVYMWNNPVNWVDPTGEDGRQPPWTEGGGAASLEKPPPPINAYAPYPYDISAFELGWLWATEQCPEYMVFDQRWDLTRDLMHDKGVNQARAQFYRKLAQGTLENGRSDSYWYRYVPLDYIREVAEYLVGYDRVGFFLGSYVVHSYLHPGRGSVTFHVIDSKNLQTASKSPCYFASDVIGPIINRFLPEELQLDRSAHSLEGLVMKAQQLDLPSDIFLASLFEPRRRSEPGVFGTHVRFGGWIELVFTWIEPLEAVSGRRQ